jgi:hypothetical protein
VWWRCGSATSRLSGPPRTRPPLGIGPHG